MKRIASLLIFTLIVQTVSPSFAQSSNAQDKSKVLQNCVETKFNTFKQIVAKTSKEPIEVDASLRLDFLKGLFGALINRHIGQLKKIEMLPLGAISVLFAVSIYQILSKSELLSASSDATQKILDKFKTMDNELFSSKLEYERYKQNKPRINTKNANLIELKNYEDGIKKWENKIQELEKDIQLKNAELNLGVESRLKILRNVNRNTGALLILGLIIYAGTKVYLRPLGHKITTLADLLNANSEAEMTEYLGADNEEMVKFKISAAEICNQINDAEAIQIFDLLIKAKPQDFLDANKELKSIVNSLLKHKPAISKSAQ